MPVNPTLLIGLGGTGKEVLLRIRRRFFEAGIKKQPWIRYLWFDTAASQVSEQYIRDLPDDYIGRRIRFDKETETVDLGATLEEVQTVINNIEHGYKNIAEWLDTTLLQNVNDEMALKAGARQIPALGRLALFIKAQEVMHNHQGKPSKLLTAIADLKQEAKIKADIESEIINKFPADVRQAVQANYALDEKPQLKVLLVGSLAGGTGSGLCVDVAAIVKHMLAQDKKSATLVGYYLLPRPFVKEHERVAKTGFGPQMAEVIGYSMLQELEQSCIRKPNSIQFLTGRDNVGLMRCSWDRPMLTEGADVPQVEAPLYNFIYLFDGYNAKSPLESLSDNFELMANILYRNLMPETAVTSFLSNAANSKYANFHVHVETSPDKCRPEQSTWCDTFTFRFASAGMYRVTREAPRLRFMAAYKVAEQSLCRWLGVETPKTELPDPPSENDKFLYRETEKLYRSVDERLRKELQAKAGAPARLWREVLAEWTPLSAVAIPADRPWNEFDEAKDLDRKWLAAGPLSEAYDQHKVLPPAPAFKTADLIADMRKEFIHEVALTGRFDELMRKLIDRPPLEGVTNHQLKPEDVFKNQGGVAAAAYCARLEGAIEARIKYLAIEFSKVAASKRSGEAAARKSWETALEDARKAAIRADGFLKYLRGALNDLFVDFIFSGTRANLGEDAKKLCADAHQKLQAACKLGAEYVKLRYETALYDAMGKVWGFFSEAQNVPELGKFCARWRKYCDDSRDYVKDMLNHNEPNDSWKGLRPILGEFQALKKNGATRHLAEHLQADANKLLDEVLKTCYGDEPDRYDRHLSAIQAQWVTDIAEMVSNKPQFGNKVVQFRHLIEMTANEPVSSGLLKRENQIDRLLEITQIVSSVDGLFANAENSIAVAINPYRDTIYSDLEDFSKLRLQLPSDVRRLAHKDGHPDGATLPYQTHVDRIGPAGLEWTGHTGDYIKSADINEICEASYELDIPLPNVESIVHAAEYIGSHNAGHIHFTHPKDGYLPIHKLSPREAAETQDQNVTAVLALMLGQFRPGPNSPCFAYRVDPASGVQEKASLRSLPDIVRAFRKGGTLVGSHKTIKDRNLAILRDMGFNLLVALDLIAEYNLNVIAPQRIKLLANNNATVEERPFSPQQLVLTKTRAMLHEVMLDKYKIGPDSTAYATAYSLLENFLHHFAEFVPVTIYDLPSDSATRRKQPHLLGLRTEIVRAADKLPADEDLLLRRQKPFGDRSEEIWRYLTLRAPWSKTGKCLYSDGDGARTLAIHDELVVAQFGNKAGYERGRSMKPPRGDDTLKGYPPGFETAEVYVSEKAVFNAEFYRKLFKAPPSDDWTENDDRLTSIAAKQ